MLKILLHIHLQYISSNQTHIHKYEIILFARLEIMYVHVFLSSRYRSRQLILVHRLSSAYAFKVMFWCNNSIKQKSNKCINFQMWEQRQVYLGKVILMSMKVKNAENNWIFIYWFVLWKNLENHDIICVNST